MTNELLTVAEVAALMRTTPKAVYLKVDRGQLPGVVREGRRLLFVASEVRKYLKLPATEAA